MTKTQERRRIIIKIVLAVAALAIAVIAITNGVNSLIKKNPGYYSIETDPAEDAMLYANGIDLSYYMDGTSSEIRVKLMEIKKDYGSSLLHIYKLLDADNLYEGYNNIAYINQHMGEEVEVSPELFEVLESAYQLTLDGEFNLFGGALYNEWESITVLEDQSESDPLLNSDEAERIKAIAEKCADINNFVFEIVDPAGHVVRFDVSDSYKRHMEGYELDNSILNLGYLTDAYKIGYIAKKLEEKGWTRGLLTADIGMSLALSGEKEGNFIAYSLYGNTPAQAFGVGITPGAAYCSYRSFGFEGEAQYYVIDGTRRHPHYALYSGELTDGILTSAAVSYSGDLVRACVNAYRLISGETAESVMNGAGSDILLAYITKTEPSTVIVDSAHKELIIIDEASGFTCSAY